MILRQPTPLQASGLTAQKMRQMLEEERQGGERFRQVYMVWSSSSPMDPNFTNG